jgi:hypothetical protein
MRHGSERRKRQPKRWNRKSPRCQLKRQRKNAAIEGRSVQKTRGRIQQKTSSLKNDPHNLYWVKAQAIFPGPDTVKGKLDLKGPYKKGGKEISV